jgi:cytochrome c oxidase subunit 2
MFVLYISLFFFALIVAAMVFFAIRYRRRGDSAAKDAPAHSTALEITWSVIPLIIVGVIFFYGMKGFISMNTPPSGAFEVSVIGQKWQWFFTYPNGRTDSELHVPVDRPTVLTMTSEDVIHSLFIPAFRMKKDVVPGRYTKAWFEPNQTGSFPILCTEYCGTGHSNMFSTIHVQTEADLKKYLQRNIHEEGSPVEVGELLYQRKGCQQCHTTDGSYAIGPSFKGIFGHTVKLKSGESVTADENYIRESILEPFAKVVDGYDAVMPTYKGKLTDQDITAIIAFIKSLSDGGGETGDE